MAKISTGIAILDSIAAANFGYSPDMMGFDMFSIDMSQSMVPVADGIEMAAMVRQAGIKESQYQLWTLKRKQVKATSGKVAIDEMAADYNEISGFEVDCNPITLALGLVEAFKTHPLSPDDCEGGEPLTIAELLDLTPTSFADMASDSNVLANRKVARKHDRSRRKAD